MKNIDFGKIKVPVEQYAVGGNAVLGIRESGKSYTATAIAEQLMRAGVPFIGFDPIGIWRFLRVPGTGKGFPVVVAGGKSPDLPLTAAGAPEIVRAAMRGNVNLIIDLFDIHLSKADWRRIVASCLRVLLYENGDHGPRHVFIEEAAEFCPQVVGPNQGEVYAEVEKLARMGGNSQLGFTLINQRAEQVNKAVLELCDTLVLHRQKGKNSLNALEKWLDVGTADGGKEIIRSLPMLENGEAWVWPPRTDRPIRTIIPAKSSFHPDRRARQVKIGAMTGVVDVGTFVEGMKGSLETLVKEAAANDPKALKAQIAQLQREAAAAKRAPTVAQPAHTAGELALEYARGRADGYEAGQLFERRKLAPLIKDLEALDPSIARLQDGVNKVRLGMQALQQTTPAVHLPQIEASKPVPRPAFVKQPVQTLPARQPVEGITGPQQRILDALAWWQAVGIGFPSRVQVAVVARYSPTGGAFQNPLGQLRTAGLVEYPSNGLVCLTAEGSLVANAPEAPPTVEQLHVMVEGILNGPQWRILDPLLRAYPDDLARAQVAAAAGYAPDGGAFQNPLGSLRSLGLIDYPANGRVVALPVLFLEKP